MHTENSASDNTFRFILNKNVTYRAVYFDKIETYCSWHQIREDDEIRNL